MSTDDSDEIWFKLDVAGFSLSFAALTFVGLAILSDKRLKTHPNHLIALICLSDAYNYFQIMSRYFFCGYKLSPYLDLCFTKTFLTPFYYILFNWFGLDQFFG